MQLSISVLILGLVATVCESYSIGGGISPNGGGGTNYNNGGTTYNGIGGGVQPGGSYNPGTNTNIGGSGQAGSYCSSNANCQAGLACTPSVNGVKICLSATNQNPTIGGGCSTSSNCQSGSTCVISNGYGNCQITAGGNISPARQDIELLNKYAPEVGKLNSACERDTDCDNDYFCTLYFGEMICREPIKPLIPLRCETESDCPSSDYLCVFSTAMQDRVCYRYGDTVTDGYVIPIKHKLAIGSGISVEEKPRKRVTKPYRTSTARPIYTTTVAVEETTNGREDEIFAESVAIFKNLPQKRGSSELEDVPRPPIYMKMEDRPPVISASIDDGSTTEKTGQKVTKVVVNEQPISGREQETIINEPIDPAASICEFDYHCRMGESCSGRVRFVDRNITVCRYDILKKHRQCIYHSDCLSGQRCKSPVDKNDAATCEPDISATLGSIPCFYDYQCSGGEKCLLVDERRKTFACRPPSTSDPRMNQLCTSNSQCPFQQVCRRTAGISMCIDISLSANPTLLQERVIQFFRNFIA